MAAEVSSKYAVQMHGITKCFGSFYALTDVDLDVERGTIHSILGENGAGKSTLMNVLYGLYQANEGEIFINGKKVNIKKFMHAFFISVCIYHPKSRRKIISTITRIITYGRVYIIVSCSCIKHIIYVISIAQTSPAKVTMDFTH